jgi:hypothetical protein
MGSSWRSHNMEYDERRQGRRCHACGREGEVGRNRVLYGQGMPWLCWACFERARALWTAVRGWLPRTATLSRLAYRLSWLTGPGCPPGTRGHPGRLCPFKRSVGAVQWAWFRFWRSVDVGIREFPRVWWFT